MSFTINIIPKSKQDTFRKWLSGKFVALAKWIYPESDDVKAFYLSLLHDYMIKGHYAVKVDLEKQDTTSPHQDKGGK